MIGGVNNLNSIPFPVPAPVPLVQHHFPLPLILNPPPQAGLYPPPLAPGSSPSASSPSSPSSFSSSPSSLCFAYPRSLRLTPRMAGVRRVELAEEVALELDPLEELLVQLLLLVAAPLAPSKRVRG